MKFDLSQKNLLMAVVVLLVLNIGFVAMVMTQVTALQEKTSGMEISLAGNSSAISKQEQAISLLQTALKNSAGALESRIISTARQLNERLSDTNSLIQQTEIKTNIQFNQLSNRIDEISSQKTDFSDVAEKSLKAVVTVATEKGLGSGVMIAGNGTIATNYHVIEGAETIVVFLENGSKFSATVSATDQANDLAIIKIVPSTPQFLELANSDTVKPGQRVIALGSPAGLASTVTQGIVSAVNRNIQGIGAGLIQIDVPINPGNSGGPLVNEKGKIVGITTAKVAGAEGLGFAIPSNKVREIIPN